MNFQRLTTLIALAGLTSVSALAQTNVGELTDMGGKKLSKQELVPILGGANVSGMTPQGAEFQSDYKADGTYAGSFTSPQNKLNGTTYGTWTVDDAGKVCIDGTIRMREVQPQKSCVFYFKNGDQYFVSTSDSDRSALVGKRVIKK